MYADSAAESTGHQKVPHHMTVLEPLKGAGMLKGMYAVFGLPKKRRAEGPMTLDNIKKAAERDARPNV